MKSTPLFSNNTRWIWLSGDEAPVNTVADFQGSLRLTAVPKKVSLLISADSRYRLHINGTLIGHGPARAYPGHYEFDEHDIASLLVTGENIIDVRVLHWGEGNFHSLVSRAGLICEARSGARVLLSSNTSWKARIARAYRRDTVRIACQLGFEEQVDLSLEQGACDGKPAAGGGWSRPVEIGAPGCLPWGKLMQRSIPLLEGEITSPVVITNRGEVGARGGEGLVLALRAGHDLGCDALMTNSEQVDGFFATRFHAGRSGRLRLRRSAMYGGPIRLFLDGKELKLTQGDFDFEAEVAIKSGDHILLLDWNGITHDTDTAVSLSGVGGLRQEDFPGHPGSRWIVATNARAHAPVAWKRMRPLLHRATTARALLATGAIWRYVASEHAPEHEVYMEISSREEAPARVITDLDFPVEIPLGAEGSARRLILDFGAQRMGRLSLDLTAGRGAVLEMMGIEAPLGLQFTEMMNNTARVVCRGGRQSFDSLQLRGMRQLILDVTPCGGSVKIHGAAIHEETYPWKPRGNFDCSDTRLNQIWELCLQTLRVNSLDVFADATYEQTLWVGDTASMLIPVHHYVQGESLLPERCLRLIAQSLERTPMVNSQVPSSWEDRLIPNWSFFWASGVRTNYEFSGNLSFLQEMLPSLAQQGEFVARSLNADGLFELHRDVWHFLDWNGTADDHRSGDAVTFAHENCLALASLADTAWMAAQAGDRRMAARFAGLAAKLRAAIKRHFWNPVEGAFGEIRSGGITSSVITASTQICALRAGLFKNAREISHKVLSPPDGWNPTGTPWMWSLGALEACASGQAPDVYKGVSRHWGRMLDHGATTAWEMFEGRHRPGVLTRSWCHGWSAGPAWILPAYALGVRPTAPGWKKVIIQPQPGSLGWAEGTVPTPLGDIAVHWEKRGGKLLLDYEVPKGVTVERFKAST